MVLDRSLLPSPFPWRKRHRECDEGLLAIYLASGRTGRMNALRCEEPSWLAENLNKQTESILVLDLRSREDFLSGHVRTSINLPCQNSLMEGRGSLEQLLCTASTAEERGRFAALSNTDVVLYDQDSTRERRGEALMAVADMLVAEKCRHVCFLNGMI